MKYLDIIVPIKNERDNLVDLVERVDISMKTAGIKYRLIFVDDHSNDGSLRILNKLKKSYPITIHIKEGKPGKAYSILEGSKLAKGEFLAMIDGDGQYPPEVIPEMFEKLSQSGVVVANRKSYKESLQRRLISRSFKFIFGQMLHGLTCDVQSGLKLFRKEVIDCINEKDVTPWTLDLPLLSTAKGLGYAIETVDIDFSKRENGVSKVKVFKTAYDIGSQALLLKLSKPRIYQLQPKQNSMEGAGVAVKGKRYITHTTLHPKVSALTTFSFVQKVLLLSLFTAFVTGIYFNFLLTIQILVGVLSTIYFVDVLFSILVVVKSLHTLPEYSFSDEELTRIDEKSLPVYSILCPLYKESKVLPIFLDAISKLDYPKNKLDVQLLLEENDTETINAAANMKLPNYVRVTVVPDSYPKTKPKACNYGLIHAKGEYLVIYDAEDIPDPKQLKKAYLAFQRVDNSVVCLQAKLNYFNPHQNLLTRLFTAEYSLWFDVVLTGFQSINTTIPLGGTSNHFRTNVLKELKGWDPFNVTEDCDLGVRLFKKGYKTSIIDSVTLEEANSNFKNWLRQRSRWLKGYLQTYLVHNREFLTFLKEHKWHALIFQLIVGMRITFIVINPLLWLTTVSYFALYNIVGPTIESFYPPLVFYMAVFSLVVGNFFYIYNYMIGCAKRDQWSLIKYVFLIPFYWLMASWAAGIAFYQLIFKPHYWEKTNHGLHLNPKKTEEVKEAIVVETSEEVLGNIQSLHLNYFGNTGELLKKGLKLATSEGAILVIATMTGNLFNFLYNAYLGRELTVDDFGLISLVGSFLMLSTIPLSSLTRSITHKTAFLLGKYNIPIYEFWKKIRIWCFYISILVTLLWLISVPFLEDFFRTSSWEPFILFAPAWIIGAVSAVDLGYLGGNLKYKVLAILLLSVSLSKFLFTFILVNLHLSRFVYAAIPASMMVSFVIGWYFAAKIKGEKGKIDNGELFSFPTAFFFSYAVKKLSEVAFFALDIVLVKHFLDPVSAGEYALLALVGKMIFFIGDIFGQFILPVVSNREGSKKNSERIFYQLFIASSFCSLLAYVAVGLFGYIFDPILLGNKIIPIISLLPIYGLGRFFFQISDTILVFEQARRKHSFAFVSLFVALIEVIAIILFHQNLSQIVWVVTVVGAINLFAMFFLHAFYRDISKFVSKLTEFLKKKFWFTPLPDALPGQQRILIFNWRDTKHAWAGGAEVYVQEVAERLVKKGYYVAIFCGNDGKSKVRDLINRVHIIRRGFFLTVYIWAFIYYLFVFRNKFDLVIDSENGIPFFTPLYVGKPKFLLIHHIHQDVFRRYLKFPLSIFAMFLEAGLMPLVYRNIKIITVSNSSKKEIEKIGLGKRSDIEVINPGIEPSKFFSSVKSKNPTVLYLGRLKQYKSIDTAIKSVAKIRDEVKNLSFIIAGSGEYKEPLMRLIKELDLEDIVKFIGRVTEEEKVKLLGSAWMLVQPSQIEGWGITAIEANACGTPVIASDVAGLRDSVKNPHTGYLVPWGNAEEMADKMKLLIKDKKVRKNLEKNCLEWAENFSWDKSTDKLVRLVNAQLDQPKEVKDASKFEQVATQTPVYNLASLLVTNSIGVLRLRLLKEKISFIPPAYIEGYKFVKYFNKIGPRKSYVLAIYKNAKGQKAIAKMVSSKVKAYHYYSLKNEIILYRIFAEVINECHDLPKNLRSIKVPQLLAEIETEEYLLCLTEFIEGETADKLSPEERVTLYFQIKEFLAFVSTKLTPAQQRLISKRLPKHYLMLYPLILTKAILTHPKATLPLLKGIPTFVTFYPKFAKEYRLELAHRDLHFFNIIISSDNKYLIDLQQVVLTDPLHDYVTTLRDYWKQDDNFYDLFLRKIIVSSDKNPNFIILFKGLIVNSATHGLTGAGFPSDIVERWINVLKIATTSDFGGYLRKQDTKKK